MATKFGGWGGKKQDSSAVKYVAKNQRPVEEEKEVKIEEIKGLKFIENFITQEEQNFIVQQLDGPLKDNWALDLKRRVQQFGYRFIYETQQIDLQNEAPPIPDFFLPILQRMVEAKLFPQMPNQMIINEYLPGQGIAPHIDKVYCFEESIASISMLSDAAMEFRHKKNLTKKNLRLSRLSLLSLQGEARYDWTHGIPARDSDVWDNHVYHRDRRISLTFRIIRNDYIEAEYAKHPALKKKHASKRFTDSSK